jgi:hypothetical protein
MHVKEARERERDMFPHLGIFKNCLLLRDVSLLKFFKEVESLKGNTKLLFPYNTSL